ncbi:2-polyprenyl-6-methoxyphenol hydroxylase-like FAD-dependent oxidoreductase [Chitinophaga skermanii]|uniref:2-polyprenyl-6-methoxyphenol hydroxylase-like FAD-dependent oxidoreductase n=1 Tax=Chitinophaga skermanii TaxID=331697 RepID=A0A327QQP6_9BACT|nr:FAD-dependent monooxygenase [Chitinophaga skermanii]RAJ06660.1 2-polyprenyl-6-methoxyphenol hydroxylase-like FAD-dependent oxidoreductase [Chitinophaga skermanii]
MKRAIIVGGGIGGLTTAIALQQKGIESTVYEQAPVLAPVGAGITLASNALNIYDLLGIAQPVVDQGIYLKSARILNQNGGLLSRLPYEELKSTYKWGAVAIHRAALQQVLVNAISGQHIQTGKVFQRYEQHAHDATVYFEDGTSDTAEYVIFADGIKSKGRQQMHPGIQPRFSGQTCWRFISPYQLPTPQREDVFEMWAKQKGLRVGYAPINGQEIYGYITTFAAANGQDDPAHVKEKLLDIVAVFPPVVRELMAATPLDKIMRNDLYDIKPFNGWSKGNVVLMGDAAHATMPNLGQGACQAIESAYVLAQCIAQHHPAAAYALYEKMRKPKATFITNTSDLINKITNTSGLMKSVVLQFMKWDLTNYQAKQMDKMLSIQYIHQ